MEHLDGRLDEAGEAEFQAHVKSCAACQVELRELGAVRAVLRAQPMVEPPRSFALPLDTPHPARVGEREGQGEVQVGAGTTTQVTTGTSGTRSEATPTEAEIPPPPDASLCEQIREANVRQNCIDKVAE